jgi:general stress protein YciG
MQCPHCQRVIPDKKALEMIPEKLILQRSAAILGSRGRGESKARDPEKMRAAGKLGGRPRKKKTTTPQLTRVKEQEPVRRRASRRRSKH